MSDGRFVWISRELLDWLEEDYAQGCAMGKLLELWGAAPPDAAEAVLTALGHYESENPTWRLAVAEDAAKVMRALGMPEAPS